MNINDLFDKTKFGIIFEYEFLSIGEQVTYISDTDEGATEKCGIIEEMFVSRTDPSEVWITICVDDALYDYVNVNEVSFIVPDEDEHDDDPLGLYMKVKKLTATATLPAYATSGAAGMDFFSDVELIIPPGQVALVKTGVAVEFPAGFELQLRARSSFGVKRVILANGVGTVDFDYRGEIMFALLNLSSQDFPIVRGIRIGQGILAPAFRAKIVESSELSGTTRGSGGFGSTGL